MPRQTYRPEEIIAKLRQAEVLLGEGKKIPGVIMAPPTRCRQDASPRPNTPAHGSSPCPRRTLDCAAPLRTEHYGPAPRPDDCKTSIIGSTPIAASNFSPAHGHFPVFAARPFSFRIGRAADILPTRLARESYWKDLLLARRMATTRTRLG